MLVCWCVGVWCRYLPPSPPLPPLLPQVSDDSLWKKHGSKRGVDVLLEKTPDPDQTMLRFRTDGVIECDVFSCLAVMYEVDTLKVSSRPGPGF